MNWGFLAKNQLFNDFGDNSPQLLSSLSFKALNLCKSYLLLTNDALLSFYAHFLSYSGWGLPLVTPSLTLFVLYFFLTLLFVCRSIINVEPLPILLSTETLPPIQWMSSLQILRPSPVPVALMSSCSASFPKFMNSLSKFSSEIPTPLSQILI